MSLLDTIDDKLDRLKDIDLNVLFLRVLDNPGIRQQMIDLNQEQLNVTGVWANGNPTGPYSKLYGKIKERKGQTSDHITLNDSGYLQGTMEVVKGQVGAVITADMVKKGFDLYNHYPYALGLTDESKDMLTPMVQELLLIEYRKEVDNILYNE